LGQTDGGAPGALVIAASKRLRDITLQVDLTLSPGVMAVAGPSGAGKSTLLRMVAGLLRPDSGTIRLGSTVLDDAGRGYHLPPGRRGISLVFQEYALFPHLSVAENVAYGLRAHRVPRQERRRRVEAMLDRLGLRALAGERPGHLSGGQRQRVAVARALVVQPRALLLDEPLAALDVQTRTTVRGELRTILRDLAIPTLLVTHDYADALVFRERIVIMDEGRVVQDGSHDTLLSHPRSRFVADFTGINYYEGRLDVAAAASEGEHLARIRLQDGSLEVYGMVLGLAPGAVGLTVRPWEVVLAAEPPSGSARNVLPGEVHDILPMGGRVRITLLVGVRRSTHLVAEITPEALQGLGCREGQTLYASFKATAVTITPL
jgi:molybdenum ABC transporter ATP-binding protein